MMSLRMDVQKAATTMNTLHRFLALLVCFQAVTAALAGENLLTNPGFEIAGGDDFGWSEHYRKEIDYSIDDTVAHSGSHSVRLHIDERGKDTGITHRNRYDGLEPGPLMVSAWYRTKDVSGRPGRQFALVVSMEYTTDTRPHHMDADHIFHLEPGTHDWTQISRVIVAEEPVKLLLYHFELLGRTGTAWFDDARLMRLSEAPIVGRPQDLAQMNAEAAPTHLLSGLDGAEADEFVLYVDQKRTQKYHRDPLRLFVNNELRFEGEEGELSQTQVVEPIGYISRLAKKTPQAPYTHVCFHRTWEDIKVEISAAAVNGMQMDVWLALPENMYAVKADLNSWEPSFDSLEAKSCRGRSVLHVTPELRHGEDGVEFLIRKTAGELPPAVPAQLPEDANTIETTDGLRLYLGADGSCVGMSLDDHALLSPVVGEDGPAGRGGFYAADLMVGTFEPIRGRLHRTTEGLAHRAVLEQQELRFVARYESTGDYIRVRGAIEDTSGEDRAVDLVFKMPMRADGWTWTNAPYDSQVIEQGGYYEVADYPFAAVSNGKDKTLAMALSPNSPARQKFAYRPQSALFHLRYKCGLTADGSGELESRFPFSFLIYRADGEWGWRDAIRRYHGWFPEYFRPRCPRHGKWLFHARPNKLANPEQFAFDEGSHNWAVDDKYGVGSYPYIIPNQREIKRLEQVPGNYEEAMEAFEEYQISEDRVNPRRQRRGWGRNIKQIIKNCCTARPNGDYYITRRNTRWGANSVTFWLNSDPDLFGDTNRPTVGGHLVDYVRYLMEENESLDGMYLDSIPAWGARPDNCRKDHRPYAAYPFSYVEADGTVCMVGRYSTLEFIRALAKMLHPTDRYLLANNGSGFHPFTQMNLDIVGIEGGTRPGRTQVEHCRPVVGKKQYCILEHARIKTVFDRDEQGQITRESYDRFAKRCVAWGAVPSITYYDGYNNMYRENKDLFDLYYRLSVRLSKAGWCAVPYARADSGEVYVERFGPEDDGTTLLTVYNAGDQERDVSIKLWTEAIGLNGQVDVRSLMNDERLQGPPLRLHLAAEELQVMTVAESSGR